MQTRTEFQVGDVVKVGKTDNKYYNEIGYVKKVIGPDVLVRLCGSDLTFTNNELIFIKPGHKSGFH